MNECFDSLEHFKRNEVEFNDGNVFGLDLMIILHLIPIIVNTWIDTVLKYLTKKKLIHKTILVY